MGAPGRREPGLPPGAAARAGGEAAGGALAARRLLAQLPGQVPRDQRPPQADAPRVGGGRRDARRRGPRAGPRPPLSGSVQRLLLARAVRRHLHQPHAACHVRAPPRGRGPGGVGGRDARDRRVSRPRHGRGRRGPTVGQGPGRDGRPRRWRWHRLVGHPGGPACAGGSHAPSARGLPRDAPSTATSGRQRLAKRPPATGRRPRSTTRCGSRSRGSPRAWSTTRTSGDPGSSVSCRRTPRPRTGRRLASRSWAMSSTGHSRSSTSAWVDWSRPAKRPSPALRSRSPRPSRSVATDVHPRWPSRLDLAHRDGPPVEARVGARVGAHDAGRRGQPAGVVGRWRPAVRARWQRHGRRHLDDRPGQRLRRHLRDDDDDRRGRLVGTDRHGLQLGGRLRAHVPGQRAAAVVARAAGTRRVLDAHGRPTSSPLPAIAPRITRERSPRSSSTATSTSRRGSTRSRA